MAAGKGRGRPAKPTQAQQLIEALDFIAVGTRDDEDYQEYIVMKGGYATAFNGQIAAGHPIAEELTVCPQLKRLRAALAKSGKSLVISETPNGQLSIKGDKPRFVVPCRKLDEQPQVEPNPKLAPLAETIKDAFNVCGSLATEAGERVIEASLLLEANTCTGTNGVALLQYWHGIDLPPAIILPKIFTAAIVKAGKPIDGFGFEWKQGKEPGEWIVGTFTIWFEGGAWIRTQCYQDRWPDVSRILNVPSNATPIPEGLFEAIDTVHGFDDSDRVILSNDRVMSHESEDVGAVYPVPGLKCHLGFNGKFMKKVAPYAKTIDLNKSEGEAVLFFGGTDENPVRGAIMGLKISPSDPAPTPAPNPEPEPSDAEISEGWGQADA